jgi:hypothetical protein
MRQRDVRRPLPRPFAPANPVPPFRPFHLATAVVVVGRCGCAVRTHGRTYLCPQELVPWACCPPSDDAMWRLHDAGVRNTLAWIDDTLLAAKKMQAQHHGGSGGGGGGSQQQATNQASSSSQS